MKKCIGKKTIAVFPLIRPTPLQTPNSAIFISKMQNKNTKAQTLNKIPVLS